MICSDAESTCLLPVVTVMTGKDVSAISWISDTLLAVAHRYSAVVHIYDLEAYLQAPSPSPVMQISTTGNGNTAMCYVACKNMLVAGSTTGLLSGYHIGTTGNGVRFSVKADCQTHEGAHTAVVSIVQISKEPTLLAVAMYSGVVCVYNCDKMATQSFSRQMRPECMQRVCVPETGIVGMSLVPSSTTEVAVTSKLGNVYTLHVVHVEPDIQAVVQGNDARINRNLSVDADDVEEDVTSAAQVTCPAAYMHSARSKV